MKTMNTQFAWLGAVAALLVAAAPAAQAQVRITEVAPWSSGNSPVGADWFELTNTGGSAVSLAGWKMDDSSASFGSAVAMTGISSIAAGQSVIFIEAPDTSLSTASGLVSAFVNNWFAGNAPANLLIGTYSGSGVGLSASGDGVTIFNSSGVQQAKVSFGASPANSPYTTFDNSAGLDNVTITSMSAIGVHGAFAVTHDATEIGSPGAIAAAVPEPESYAMLMAGLGVVGFVARRRSSKPV